VLAIHTLVKAGDPVATVRGPFGAHTTLNAASNVDVPGWPGMRVQLHARIPQVTSGIATGTAHGELTVSTTDDGPGRGGSGAGELAATALHAGTGMLPPSTWERIRHHR
jgi:D-alanyl-D-alanine carboxypeptidase (penicillin-binding protein 5/6)